MMRQHVILSFTIACSFMMLCAFVRSNSDFDMVYEDSIGLGTYSISLSVADIKASFEFYEKLGFREIEGLGSIEDSWIVMTNGETRLGLFQGMFPQNTITFNPKDARHVHKSIEENGLTPTFTSGLDKEEGPCTFSLKDPDGNPILIDQH